jgi:hypothetical protein
VPVVIDVDDPRADDVRDLLAAHLAFSRGVTPLEYSFALDVDALAEPSVTLFSARSQGYHHVSLETGTTEEFAPARALYAHSGFRPCPPLAP